MSSPETVGPYYGSNPYFNSEYPFSSEMYNMYIVIVEKPGFKKGEVYATEPQKAIHLVYSAITFC